MSGNCCRFLSNPPELEALQVGDILLWDPQVHTPEFLDVSLLPVRMTSALVEVPADQQEPQHYLLGVELLDDITELIESGTFQGNYENLPFDQGTISPSRTVGAIRTHSGIPDASSARSACSYHHG